MSVIAGRLRLCKPAIDVKIMATPQRVAQLKKAGLAFPEPVTIPALLDTGASGSSIDVNVIKGLGLTPTGSAQVHTPGKLSMMDEYDVSFVIGPGGDESRSFSVSVIGAELASGGGGFLALIGWNILVDCILTCDGPAGTFTLEYRPDSEAQRGKAP